MSRDAKPKLLIMGNFHSDPSTEAFLSKFLKLVLPLSAETTLVSGGLPQEFTKQVEWIQTFERSIGRSLSSRLVRYTVMQLQLVKTVARVFSLYDPKTVIFLSPSPLVMFYTKLCRRRIILYQGGSAGTQKSDRSRAESLLLKFFYGMLVNSLAGTIVVESKSSIQFQHLHRYKRKIVIAPLFVDTDIFHCTNKIQERKNVIGFFGSIDQNKGIKEFLLAVSKLAEWARENEIRVLIGGQGREFSNMVDLTQSLGLADYVDYLGWIPHESLPVYLNKLKLLVLPSHSEGLPNIVLEAMTCGTPVLATTVGGIPDLIQDGKTGFIIQHNSPDYIAQGIIRAMTHPDLEAVAESAQKLIDAEFSYNSSLKRYADLLRS